MALRVTRERVVELLQGLLVAFATAVLILLGSGFINDKVEELEQSLARLRQKIVTTEAERDALVEQFEALLRKARRKGVDVSGFPQPNDGGGSVTTTPPSPKPGGAGGPGGGNDNGDNGGGNEDPAPVPPPGQGEPPPPPPSTQPPPPPECVLPNPLPVGPPCVEDVL